jgi:hypothetical protein
VRERVKKKNYSIQYPSITVKQKMIVSSTQALKLKIIVSTRYFLHYQKKYTDKQNDI